MVEVKGGNQICRRPVVEGGEGENGGGEGEEVGGGRRRLHEDGMEEGERREMLGFG
jgi:hypothetical protein